MCPRSASSPSKISSGAALQYEQTRESVLVSRKERGYRVGVRSNITKALTALDLSTVNDIQQTSAALAQCTVSDGVVASGQSRARKGRGK